MVTTSGFASTCVKKEGNHAPDDSMCITGGNPVALKDGNKQQTFVDWSSGGAFPLMFTRSYSAFYELSYAPNSTMFGMAWRSNFDAAANYVFSTGAVLTGSPVAGDRIHIALPDGYEYHFVYNSNIWRPTLASSAGTWTNFRTDAKYGITVTATTVEFRQSNDVIYIFDNKGALQQINLPNGLTQSVMRSNGLVSRVVDSLGRWMEFDYDSTVQQTTNVVRMRSSDGKSVNYTYQPRESSPSIMVYAGERVLASAIYPDLTPLTLADNPKHVFAYANIPLTTGVFMPNRTPLASITDEKGVVYATWTYDNQARAITSTHAGNTDSFSFAYDTINNKTTVINPLGKQTVYSFNKLPGRVYRLTQVDGVASSNCVASNSQYAYDANGYRNSVTDAEGRVTKMTNDALGRPVSITEGFGTPDATTRTITWDPSFPTRRLAQTVTEPGETTGFTYNSDGQVATLTETDLTVTPNKTRTTSFGYTSFAVTQPPAISAPQAALVDVPLTVLNPNASGGATSWTVQAGGLTQVTAAPCSAANPCFSGNVSDPGVAYQDIVLPAATFADIDAGKRAVNLSWIQSGYKRVDIPEFHKSTMRMQFLDVANAPIASGAESPFFFENWTTRSAIKPVPVGTRTIRIAMYMVRNRSYVDDISLKLVSDGAATATPFVRVTNPGGDAGNTSGWTEEYDTAYYQSPTPPPADVIDLGGCTEFSCFRDASAATDAMSQLVDLPSAFYTSIDANARRLELKWLEKESTQDSRFGVEVTFLDAANVQLGLTSSSALARSYSDWSGNSFAVDVPALARKLRLRVRFSTSIAPREINKAFAAGFTAQLIGRLASPSGVKLLTSVDGPLLLPIVDKVYYAYNSNGSLTSVTDPAGLITKITALTANGLPATILAPKLAADLDSSVTSTTLAYDARDRLTTVTVNPGASQAQTLIAYDAVGQITRITQADGSYLDYVWSDARRLTSVANNTGEKIEYGYNLNGDVTSSTIKTSANVITRQMTMVYDELGRLMQSIGAAAQTTTLSYDRTDLQVQTKDPRNNLYGFSYDALQRLIHTQDQAGGEVTVTRNAQDDVTSYKDDRTITTTYVRNGFGEVTQEVSPDAGTTTYTRDERGLVTQETDGRGIITNRTYDLSGRLLTETYPAATAENVTYTYDNFTTPAGNKGRGKLTRIADQSGSTAYVYNALGQIITDTRVIATKTYVTSYLYNAAGKVTQITYPSGRIVFIARNTNGQVTGVTTKQNATAAVVNVATGITYAPLSNLLTAMTHGNLLQTTAGYDLDYRLSSLTLKDGATSVSALAYAYTDGMNLTGITDGVTAANSNTLGYSLAIA